MNKLAERAYAQVVEAERLKALIEDLKQEPGASFIVLSYVHDWETAAMNAVYLCR